VADACCCAVHGAAVRDPVGVSQIDLEVKSLSML